MRITVRVTTGAGRDAVGGRYGTGEPPVLRVQVRARPVEGRANQAVVDVVARAVGIRRDKVTIVRGGSARTKVLEVAGLDAGHLAALLESSGTGSGRALGPGTPPR